MCTSVQRFWTTWKWYNPSRDTWCKSIENSRHTVLALWYRRGSMVTALEETIKGQKCLFPYQNISSTAIITILLWDYYVIWRITACTGNVWENSTGQCMAKIGENFPDVPRRRRAPRSKGLDACFNARTSVVPECAHNSSTAGPKYWFFTELIRHMT